MRRRAAAAAALLAVLSLAACGIQESDVVEAGGAATVAVYPPPEFRMVLYFLGPNGQPVPVARDVGPPVPDPTFAGGVEASRDRKAQGWASGQGQDTHGTPVATDKVLAALLSGPAGADTAAGLTTGLPRSENAPRAEAVEGLTPEGRRRVRLRLPFPVMGLSDAAVQQLVCTTAYAEDNGGRVDVTLISVDGARPATRCET
ncbi:hypothetical protein ACH4A8_02865 [Streptomyces vietnamensis]|uniref:hypothetical protein n=1 Tax=Streptomyces vietnamensis TaxID=362257 RepID=UPI0037B10515